MGKETLSAKWYLLFRCGPLRSQGIGFINLNDIDGSLSAGTATAGMPPSSVGVANTAVLGPNAMQALPTPACFAESAWNGFICPRIRQRSFILASLGEFFFAAAQWIPCSDYIPPPISTDNIACQADYGGLQVTRVEDPHWAGIRIAENATWRTSTTFGTTFDSCADATPAGWYAGTLTAGSLTQLAWPATQPSQMRFSVNMPDPAEGAVLRLFVEQAYAWSVFVNGVQQTEMVPDNATDVPLPTDPAGTYLFDPQRRTLWWTARGGEAARNIVLVQVSIFDMPRRRGWGELGPIVCVVVVLHLSPIAVLQTAAIQLNLHLAVSAEAFDGPSLIYSLACAYAFRSQVRFACSAHTCTAPPRSPPRHQPGAHPRCSSKPRLCRRYGERIACICLLNPIP